MTERVEERLGSVMAQRADTLVEGPRFSADDIVAAGRSAVVRRRTVAAASVAAGVVVLLVVAGLATAAKPRPDVLPPADPPAISAGDIGLDVLSGNVIQRPDGSRVSLALPAGVTAGGATRVPGGWVVEAGSDDESSLWFAVETGRATRIGRLFGNYQVSADGRLLVASGTTADPATVIAYELPSLRELARTSFDSGMGPVVAGISGDRVLLNGAQGSPGRSEAAVWNIRTGDLHPTGIELWTFGVSLDGDVLRRVDRAGPGGAKDVTSACVDVVPLADSLPVGQTGLCAVHLATPEGYGQISPDGDWAFLNTSAAGGSGNLALVRSADLRAGRWQPLALDLPSQAEPVFWDTEETFIVYEVAEPRDRRYRCGVARPCEPLVMPDDLPDAQPVPRRGG